jgi:hypothetical protein
MWSSLKPTSDLQRAQQFDDYDLAANRLGVFSARQRRRFLIRSLVNHTFGLLTSVMVLAVSVHNLSLRPNLGQIEDVFILLLVMMIVSFVISVRPLFLPNVETVTGLLRKDTNFALDSLQLELVVIGPQLFYLAMTVFDALDEGAIYRVFFLKRAERIGGNLLLSMELVEDAPYTDEGEDSD